MASTGRYTPSELKLIEILRENGGSPMSSKNIVKTYYPPGKLPVNANRSIVTILNKIIRKNKKSREKFTIKKSQRNGPHPVEFWMETKR